MHILSIHLEPCPWSFHTPDLSTAARPRPQPQPPLSVPATGAHGAVPISSIRELRLNQPPTDGYPAARWITVVYTVNNTQWKVLHMTALTDDVYDLWTKTLTALVAETSDRLIAQVTPTDPDLMWIRQLWPAGAKVIDFNTAAGLCGGLGMIVPPQIAEKYTVGRDHEWWNRN